MIVRFRIEICGKDSVCDGLSDAAYALAESQGGQKPGEDDFAYEQRVGKHKDKLRKLVERFLVDSDGGEDSVTVEFDTLLQSCIVVPVKDAPRTRR